MGLFAQSEARSAYVLPSVSAQTQLQGPLVLETSSLPCVFYLRLNIRKHSPAWSLLQSSVPGSVDQDGSEALESALTGTRSTDLLSPQRRHHPIIRCLGHTVCMERGGRLPWGASFIPSTNHHHHLQLINQLTILMSSQTAGAKSFLRSLRKINGSEPELSSGIKGTLRGASVPFTLFSVGCVLQSFSSPHNTEGHLGQESGSNEFTFRGSSYLGP